MGGIVLQPSERDPQRIVDSIRQLNQGRNNATGKVTLRLNQTTTVVAAVNCSKDSQVFIDPRNADAASERLSTYVADGDIGQGTFTITHPSNSDTRVWGWVALG